MDDLLSQFEARLNDYERVKQWRESRTTYEEQKDADVTLLIVALDLCNFLIEHDATVTFPAHRDAATPTATAETHGFDPTANFVKVKGGWDKRGVGG